MIRRSEQTNDLHSTASDLPRIAVFAGPTATILNSHPLITSDKAAERHGLPRLVDDRGRPYRFDVLRPQRLAAPVTVYVEQFSAHPLESDVAELYAPPDGYIGQDGTFSTTRRAESDVPAYEVTLEPEDGLYLLPYMARQADGRPWDGDTTDSSDPLAPSRQPFSPDGARLFEEIDRFALGEDGMGSQLSRLAEYDFVRAAPSGGYTKGLAAGDRTDIGEGEIAPEELGRDYFPYRPRHLRREPPIDQLARLTNIVQATLASGRYAGAVWLEGSPFVEETSYWLNLLIDTPLPIATLAGHYDSSGHHNVINAVRYVVSRIWADEDGRDQLGVVVVNDQQLLTAREVQKIDDRPGAYVPTGGHGGVVGSVGLTQPEITFIPWRRHTRRSELRLTQLPRSVPGVVADPDGQIRVVDVPVLSASGELSGEHLPQVTIMKHARFLPRTAEINLDEEVEIRERVAWNLRHVPLSGLVAECGTPYGHVTAAAEGALRRAALSGIPFVRVSRGNADGFVHRHLVHLGISGSNLTATKARILLMACLLRLGALPPARDPDDPTPDELAAVKRKLAEYQAFFDRH